MTKVKLLKIISFCFSIFFSFGFAYVLVRYNSEISKLEIVKGEFVLNLIGILMGLSIAVITFLFTTIEKIRSNLLEIALNNNEVKGIENNIKKLYKSIMKDTIAIFIFFVLLLLCILTKGIDFPVLKVPLNLSKEEAVLVFKLSLLFLTLSALFDIIMCLFGIITGFSQPNKSEIDED